MFSSPKFGNRPSVVQFPDLDGEILELCTRSLLTSEIILHSGNIECILHCATLLQVSEAATLCTCFAWVPRSLQPHLCSKEHLMAPLGDAENSAKRSQAYLG